MHLPALALPGAASLLLDPAGLAMQQRVFGRPPSMQHSLVPQSRTLVNLDTAVVGGSTPSANFSKSFTGPVFAGSLRIIVTALATNFNLGIGAASGILIIRDNTAGGSAVWLIDPNGGAIQLSSNITKTLALSWSADWRLQQTTGAVPTTYGYAVVATG